MGSHLPSSEDLSPFLEQQIATTFFACLPRGVAHEKTDCMLNGVRPMDPFSICDGFNWFVRKYLNLCTLFCFCCESSLNL